MERLEEQEETEEKEYRELIKRVHLSRMRVSGYAGLCSCFSVAPSLFFFSSCRSPVYVLVHTSGTSDVASPPPTSFRERSCIIGRRSGFVSIRLDTLSN